MDAQGWFARHVDPTKFVGGVALGDLGAITLLVAVGQYQHGGTPLARPIVVLEGAVPFYVAWIVVALLAGLYTEDALVTSRRAAAWTIPAWIVADVVAVALRATPAFAGNLSVVFALVSMLFGGLFVVGWRSAVPVLRRRARQRRTARDDASL